MRLDSSKTVEALINAVSEPFETMAFSEVMGYKELEFMPKWTSDAVGASISIDHPIDVILTIAFKKEHAKGILDTIYALENPDDYENILPDFIGEFANTVAGKFAKEIQRDEGDINLGLPTFVKDLFLSSEKIGTDRAIAVEIEVEEENVICYLKKKNIFKKDNTGFTSLLDEVNIKTKKDDHKFNILFVNNSEQEKKELQKILSPEGITISHTSNGGNTISLISEKNPKLILIDTELDGEDSYETCKMIKSNPDTADLPVLFSLTSACTEEKIKTFKAGGTDYITKPYHPEEVLNKIKNYLPLNTFTKKIKEHIENLNFMLEERTKDLIKSQKQAVFGEMVQGIIHNMKSPLTGISGSAQLMQLYLDKLNLTEEDISKDDDLHQNLLKRLEAIQGSSNRLLEMMESLLRKSKQDQSENFELVNINDIIKQELDFLEADFFFKHKVEKKIEFSKKPLIIYGVPSMISQVFENIVRNALDAMYKTELPVLNVKTGISNDRVWFSVTDNGHGIPKEVKDKIFDPFFTTKPKVKSPDKKEPVGTGLGLNVCQKMINFHHGRISIRSTVNKGTTFKIQIPAIQNKKIEN